MTKVVSLETIRDHLEAFITDIQVHGTSIIIQQEDHRVAVLLSADEYAALKQLEKQAALQDLGALLDQIHTRNAHVSEDEVAQDVASAYHEGQS